MLQILSLLFGTIARRKTCLWIQGPDKNLEQKCPSRVIHNRCGSCAGPLLSNPQEISKLILFHPCAHIQQKSVFNLTLTLIQTLSLSDVICLQIGRIKIWSRARVTSVLQHNILGQIPHAQLPLRSKYGQHLFPDWAQNVSLLLLKWKRAWAFEHYSIGQTCQLNLCPVIRNNFTKPLIFCFHDGACWNIRHWR